MPLIVRVQSIGTQYTALGGPTHLMLDVDDVPTPDSVPELLERDGRDADVVKFVLNQDAAINHLAGAELFARQRITAATALGGQQLRLVFACTSGAQRSVVLAEELGRRLREAYPDDVVRVHVQHFDLWRWPRTARPRTT